MKLTTFLTLALTFALPSICLGGQHGVAYGGGWVPGLALVAPFIAMLFAIAFLPLINDRWDRILPKIFVSCFLGVPVATIVFVQDPARLYHTGLEYFQFLSLLASLFYLAGGIHLSTNLRATPRNNTLLLGIGYLLASVVGTTGAAMLMIYPLLRTNSERRNKMHTVIFFIFLVCNAGGMLTPIGDPPLFLGYLKGIDFFWFLKLIPMWVFNGVLLLASYYGLDIWQYRREAKQDIQRDDAQIERPRLYGGLNILFLMVIPTVVALKVPTPYREAIMWGMVCLSMWYQSRSGSATEARERNGFTWHPIMNVAAVFAGIFMTMIPALVLLEAKGAEFGFTSPAYFFFATGVFSAFLDNAPTFLVFLAFGQATMGVPEAARMMVGNPAVILAAISSGAVLFGAMTYIGNAPNLMVRSIVDERGDIRMPSFFGYMLWSIILIPIFWASMHLFLEVLPFPLSLW